MKRFDYGYLKVLLAILAFATTHSAAAESFAMDPLVVFLVRHAEKADTSRDPALSPAGSERAEQLASMLRDAKVEHIHSSDFIRTRDTAAPLASQRNLKIELYDHGELPTLVAKMRQAGGRHLVVGHSTTTPKVVELLGGTPGTAIHEAGEFDRLYVVTVDARDKVSTVLMHYGTPFKDPAVE